MTPILISFGSFIITPLTILLLVAFFISAYFFWYFLHKREIDENSIFDLLFSLLFLGALFGRIQYVITHPDIFSVNYLRSFLFMKYPGFSLGFSLCFVLLFIYLFSKKKKLSLLYILDFFSFCFLTALSITSLGFLLSGVGYGIGSKAIGSMNFPGVIGQRIPLSLYEFILTFLTTITLFVFHKRFPNHRDGLLFFLSLVFYGMNICILEMFRVNDIYFLFTIRIGYIIGFIFVLIGLIGLYKKGFFIFLLSIIRSYFQSIKNIIKPTTKKEI